MKYIDPKKLLPGDILLTTSLSVLGTIIRRRTWREKGWFDMNCATHTAVVCDRGGGLYYACEMLGGGIEMSELSRYDNKPGSLLNHVIAVRRHPLLGGSGDDCFDRREKINRFMIDTHSFNVRYGFDKLIEMIFPRAADDPYTMICSQWAHSVFSWVKVPLPFSDLCTPADWQKWNGLADINFSVDGKK